MSRTAMNRAFGFIMVFLACLPLSAGCSSERLASSLLETTTAHAQVDASVHNAQAELAALRRDLAAARIATSKQEGGVAELHRKNTALEADRAELRKMLEQAHSDVNALQNERDELKQALAKTQTVSVARQESSAPTKLDETDLQADMKELNARMVLLTDELAQLKQRFANNVRATAVRPSHESSTRAAAALGRVARDEPTQPRIVPSAVFLAPAEPTSRPDHASDRSPQQSLIRVHPGDSLWKLAHKHATTIDELKRVNGLTTDVVHAGQRLILPSSGGLDGRRCSLASPCTNPIN
jgi:predicted  nucleic acid-binding Zn-ribbon protein